MNRKSRRAALKSCQNTVNAAPAESRDGVFATAELMADANVLFQQGQAERAEAVCNRILAREPSHVHALNLLGLIFQSSGRHRRAVKVLRQAVASDAANAACHYNLAASYESLNLQDEAATHFKKAIAFGARQNNTEKLILQSPAIMACVDRMEAQWPMPIRDEELFQGSALDAIAADIFLRCALATVPLRGVALERFLTRLRATMLVLAHASIVGASRITPDLVALLAAIAQQCFINEYVFAQSGEETIQAARLKELLLQKAADGDEIVPQLLASVAAYFPLHRLANARSLVERRWPESAKSIVRQQISEPVEEAEDSPSISLLTTIDDAVSLQVMQQYEENPYPRWTLNPLATVVFDREGSSPATNREADPKEILIAGCGSGQHAVETALLFPNSRVLAIDISLPSLAYARRKTRDAGLRNVEFGRADILEMATIGRRFDRIESVGVLHHLAEPEAGLRIMVSLLRPAGEMRLGLYSETARRGIVAARKFVAERGYGPTPAEIRQSRQEILRDFEARGWRIVVESSDFYSLSGCRDLLFNVMEHRLDIPQIKKILNEHSLTFLGFDLDPRILVRFATRFPGAGALLDLDKWQAFEADNPQTFRHMYVFTVRKAPPAVLCSAA
jgi:SAM-dependent methyltransferase